MALLLLPKEFNLLTGYLFGSFINGSIFYGLSVCKFIQIPRWDHPTVGRHQIAEWPTEKIYNLFWIIFRVRGYYFKNKKEDSATNICDLEQIPSARGLTVHLHNFIQNQMESESAGWHVNQFCDCIFMCCLNVKCLALGAAILFSRRARFPNSSSTKIQAQNLCIQF